MKRKTKNIIVLFLLMLSVGVLQAQVDKGVTRTGKAVDCSTLDPSVDKAVSERGKIVTHPRVTRNGKIIKTGCCPTLEENSLTDTVTCVSVSMAATISDGTASTAVLQVFSDAAYNTQVGSDIPATVTEGKISAQTLNLNCHTRYYFRLKLNNQCNYDWTDSTRDLTLEKVTTCSVEAARDLDGTSDLSHEHYLDGSTTEIDSVYDHQGNAYSVVQIGEQCWLRENMRCTTSPNGYLEAGSSDWLYSPRYYLPDTASVDKCGYLYNWAGAIDVEDGSTVLSLPANHRGICPAGWHVPDTIEWIALRNTLVGSSTSYHYYDGYDYYADNTPIATILAGSCDWKIADDPSNKPGDYANSLRNSTCFNLTPTPYAGLNLVPCPNYFREDSYNEEGKSCYLWSANSLTDGKAARLSLHYSQTGFGIGRTDNDGTPYKQAGRNVRCLRDVLIPEMSICEDTTFGTVTLKDMKNAVKIEFIQGTTVKKTVNNPDTAVYVSDLAVGTYKVKATSATGDTLIDNARVKHTYTHCTGTPRVGTDLGGGKLANNEWSSVTHQIDSVSDHEGNVYEVVQIGNQCWLKENMRCETSPNGVLTQGTAPTTDVLNPRCYNYEVGMPLTLRERGLLYNWAGAMDSTFVSSSLPAAKDFPNHRGICPAGWHLPTDNEWNTMENAVVPSATDINISDVAFQGASTSLSAMLSTGCYWNGNNNEGLTPNSYSNPTRNSTGFSVLPAGHYNGTFNDAGLGDDFWSATSCTETSTGASGAWSRNLDYNMAGVARSNFGKFNGFSVRCLRDVIIPEVSVCEDTTFGQVTLTTLTNADKVEFYQGSTLKKTDNAPAQGKVYADLPQGTYSVIATSSSGHTDTVTAYVKHTYTHCTGTPHAGTDLGNGKFANREWGNAEINQIDSVSDHEGNVYEVVQINNQCWLKQNMRATTEPSGTIILQNPVTDISFTDRRAYAIDNNADNIPVYGLLYNWPAAVDTTASTTKEISFVGNRRGICPQGWHLPSSAEFQAMANYLNVGINSGVDALKIVSSCGWSAAEGDTPGNLSADKNISGLSLLPTGFYHNGDLKFSSIGETASIWTATSGTAKNTNAFAANYNQSFVKNWSTDNASGRSVRCVRNATASLTVSSDKSNAKICSPDAATITYTANLVGATASSYSWSTGEVTNTNTLTVNYTTTGTYTVSCTAASLLSNEVSVNITNGTAAKFGVCEEFVSGTAQVIDEGNCNSFVWKNASGDTVQTGKSIAVSASIPAGIYTVVGAITGGCSATRTVTLGNSTFKPCHVSSRGSNEFGSESDIVETVTDHQNNSYSVVEIGGQCWMRENLRCTENLSHTNLIVNHDVNDIDVAHAYNFNDNPEYGSKYGVLYNWKAAMNGAPSTTANPSNVRGLCPEGWHLPSKAEWQVLLTTVGVGTKNSGRLATGCDWWVDDRNTTTPGDYSYVERNSSGFSARPFGNIVAGTYYGESFNALFWTATELPAGSSFTAFDQVPPYQVSLPSNENAYYFYSYFNRSDILFDLNQGVPPVTKFTQKDNAYYVRCVRNN